MRVFNAFQIVMLLALGPWLIAYLSTQSFRGSVAAFWGGIILYGIGIIFATVCVHDGLKELDRSA